MWIMWWIKATADNNSKAIEAGNETKTKMMKHASENIVSILKSITSFNLKTDIFLLSSLGGFTLGSISGIITDWIYDPSISFYALMMLIVSDHISGMALAWKHNRFETRKATRIFWTLLSHIALLSFATNLSKGSEILYWLNEGIFVPLVIVNILSLIKNLSLLGYIKSDISKILYNKIDAYKNEYIKGNRNDVPHDGC